MPKRTPREKLFEWRVIKIKSTPATLIGYFKAPDAEQAIKLGIAELETGGACGKSRNNGRPWD
jgi:hypothetical protein